MSDLISRQAAIDVVDAVWSVTGDKNVAKVWDQIKDLPSVQPQRMRGKWTYGEDEYGIDGYHCDKCGFFVPWDYTHKFINFIKDYHFCPNCGADMRGEQDDESRSNSNAQTDARARGMGATNKSSGI